MEKGQVELYRRDTGEKQFVSIEKLAELIPQLLIEIQQNLLSRNQQFRENNTVSVDDFASFEQALDEGKFVMAHRDGTTATEEKIKEETKATIRCIPLDQPAEQGKCIKTGNESKQRVLFARAY